MHGRDVLDSRVLVHESLVYFFFYASVCSTCSSADACWFACKEGLLMLKLMEFK